MTYPQMTEDALMLQVSYLRKEVSNLRKAAKYLIERPRLESGSIEMTEGDAFCAQLGLEPWKHETQTESTKVYY